MTLADYVIKHSARGSCRCGSCVDAPSEPVKPVGHTVNMVFFDVAKDGDPSAKELLSLIRSHRGDLTDCDPLDGREHSYIELGGWIGDQGLALKLMGLGTLLGVWSLLSPYTVFGEQRMPQDLALKMAGSGFLSVQRKAEAPSDDRREDEEAMDDFVGDDLDKAISVIESVEGFTDESTEVGKAWAIILEALGRVGPCDPEL